MKKVVLGIGMLISGIIGFVGVIEAVVFKGTLDGNWPDAIIYEGLIVPFIIFIMLAVSGLFISILGVKEKEGSR